MSKKTSSATHTLALTKKTLSFWERINLRIHLPTTGTFEGKIAISDLKKKLSFSQEEIKKFKVSTDETTGNISWSKEAAKLKFDFVFTELENLQLQTAVSTVLTVLDKKAEVTDEWIQLATKFDAKPIKEVKK